MPDGSIVLMGGFDGSRTKNDVWRSIDYGATWTLVNASAGWSARYLHTSVAMPDGSIVLMGGASGGLKNDTWQSTDNGATWRLMNASSGWTGRWLHSCVAMPDGSIVLMGGFNGQTNGAEKNDVWQSADNGATWTLVNASAGWSPRRIYSTVVMPDGSIVLLGGFDGDSTINDVWRSTNNGATWMQMKPDNYSGWMNRQFHSSVAMPDGSIVLMGGATISGIQYQNDVWRSTNNGATWTKMPAEDHGGAGWSAREGHTSVLMPDGSIVLIGGSGDYAYNDTWLSTNNGATWALMNASAGWSARYQHTSVAMADGSIVLMGGQETNWEYKNDVWRSTDLGATWTQLPDALWSAREGHTSVAMPEGSIILMGGEDDEGYKNDVWQSTDNGATWTLINVSAGWSARYAHSSVAMPDGSIVLMGGYVYGYINNDDWRSTDNGATWTLVTASSGGPARSEHTSVVMPDGSIVTTGGQDLGWNDRNDAWRFQPAGSSLQDPSHTYTAPGNYKVALQAYNTGGYNSTRKTSYITVTSGAPISPVRNLKTGLNYTTISSAVAALTENGNTIIVDSGRYNESVEFNSFSSPYNATLLGHDTGGGWPVVDAMNSGSPFEFSGVEGIVLDKFVVTNSSAEGAGILVYSANNLITNITAINNRGPGINLRAVVSTSAPDHNIIRNVHTTGNMRCGIYIAGDISGGHSNTIINVTSDNNDTNGITIENGHSNQIFNSTITENAFEGLNLWGATNTLIRGNTIEGNGEYGMYLNSASSSNTIYNNKFTNIVNVVDDAASTNFWNLTTKTAGTNIIGGSWLGGNSWSDYEGVDTNGDGIGNTLLPYTAGGMITIGGDRLPLTILNGTQPVVANYTANVTSGTAPLTVRFTDISTGSPMPTIFNMSFGDGAWLNTSGPWVHTYTHEGTYFPVIYASNGISNASGTNATISVNVTPGLDPGLAEAYNVVLENETILNGTATGKSVSASLAPVPAGSPVQLWGGKPALSAPTTGWVIFIDDYPGANWEHRCRYVFVDANGKTTVIQAMSPPTNINLGQIAGEPANPGGDANSVTSASQNPGGGLGLLNLNLACTGPDCSHNYALLISGGFNTTQNHVRYWNDISFMYQTLNQTYGYPADHITVLMSDGTNSAPDRHNATAANGAILTDNSPVNLDTLYGPVDVSGNATKANVNATLKALNSKLTAADSLFIFTTSHGGWDGVPLSNNSILYLWNQEYISDTDFVNALPASPGNITITMEQCYSGGFVDNFIDQYSGPQRRIIATAANGSEPSWGNGFSNAWTSGVARIDEERLPNLLADTNNDNKISMAEAYNYTLSYDPSASPLLLNHEHPQYSAKNPGTAGTTQYLSTCPVSVMPGIRVTTPNTAESWKKGSTYYITWTQTGLAGSKVNISLWKGADRQQYIAEVPASSLRYFWSVPGTLATGNDYWINISSVATTTPVFDRSDTNFAVAAPGVSGYLQVNSTPASSTIYIDDVARGVTNVKLTLPDGEHNVTVTKADYYAVQSTAAVKSSQTTVANFMLDPVQPTDVYPYGSIVIDSSIQGAAVYIDGNATGLTTPANTEIMYGNHAVYVTSYGYVTPPAQTVYVPQHMTVNVEFTLTTPVSNVAPLVDAGPDAAITNGSRFSQSGSFIDPGADTWTATVSYGDGSGTPALTLNPDKTFDLNHTYGTAGEYTVTVTVTDNHGGAGTDTAKVTVNTMTPIPPNTNPPTDPDHDGIYEDLNGNTRLDFADVVLYFNQMEWIAENEPVTAFDLNGNGRIDFADIVRLFGEI
jgi:parallel beta-helix repeat protein